MAQIPRFLDIIFLRYRSQVSSRENIFEFTKLSVNRQDTVVALGQPAVMISAYGYVAGSALNVPRAAYALSIHGDFPRVLSRLHARYDTPALAICVYSILVWLLALSGTFLWVVAISAGSTAVYFAALCVSLIRLRKIQPQAEAVRLPFGRAFAVAGVVICAALFTQLSRRQMLLMGVTALLATANWLWARRAVQREIDSSKLAGA